MDQPALTWPFGPDRPDVVALSGTVLRRSMWSARSDTNHHYRSTDRKRSVHLVVGPDDVVVDGHVDQSNPDAGWLAAAEHFVKDTIAGQVTLVVGSVAAVAAVTVLGLNVVFGRSR